MAGNPGADRDWGRHQDQVRVLLIYVKSNEKSLGFSKFINSSVRK